VEGIRSWLNVWSLGGASTLVAVVATALRLRGSMRSPESSRIWQWLRRERDSFWERQQYDQHVIDLRQMITSQQQTIADQQVVIAAKDAVLKLSLDELAHFSALASLSTRPTPRQASPSTGHTSSSPRIKRSPTRSRRLNGRGRSENPERSGKQTTSSLTT